MPAPRSPASAVSQRAAEQAAGIAHRVLAAHAGPVFERRPGDDDRPEELGAERGEDHHRPARLAVADHAGLALGLRVAGDHRLEEDRLGAGDVENGLAGHRVGQEADEIGGVAGLHRDADLAVGLEAADARSMPRPRVDDHERPLLRVDRHALGRRDAREQVVHRPLQPPAVEDELSLVVEYVRRDLGRCCSYSTARRRITSRKSTDRCQASIAVGGGIEWVRQSPALRHISIHPILTAPRLTGFQLLLVRCSALSQGVTLNASYRCRCGRFGLPDLRPDEGLPAQGDGPQLPSWRFWRGQLLT